MTEQPPFQDEPSPDYSAATPPPPPPQPAAGPPPPPPPPAYAAPVGEQPLSQSDERLWAMLAHLSEIVLAIIAPLLIMVLLGKRSAFVEDQAKEALNFHITLLIASVVSWILIFVFVGIFLLIAVIIYGLVFAIIAAIKSYNGELYRYPVTFRFVK
jgi:uncharacterized Tic20 family protein